MLKGPEFCPLLSSGIMILYLPSKCLTKRPSVLPKTFQSMKRAPLYRWTSRDQGAGACHVEERNATHSPPLASQPDVKSSGERTAKQLPNALLVQKGYYHPQYYFIPKRQFEQERSPREQIAPNFRGAAWKGNGGGGRSWEMRRR